MPEPELSFDDWWNAHRLIASLVPSGVRVLDIGCGFGAAAACERILNGVAEGLDRLGLPEAGFDAIVFADVLEHLVDPWTVLRQSLTYLQPGGRVVISIPNIANYGARLNLLKGEFRYQDFGIYDRTHLRFFTRATAEEMVRGAGLTITARRYTPNLTETGLFRRTLGRVPPLRKPFRMLDRWLAYRKPELFAVQFILACDFRPETEERRRSG
jgi:2-polyprenyl-3-methyl-5-hydroxy-6-metoxy-1,4-benzoquinol methylase